MRRPGNDSLRLMLVTDGSWADSAEAPSRLVAAIRAALNGGVTAVMVREKALPSLPLYHLARSLREATREAGAALIVNDRAHIAVAADADGVHLGWQSMPVERVREVVGPERLIGVSTHTIEEALEAEQAGADYVTFGPVFPTPSKAGLVDVQGLDGVRALREAGLRIPLVGLGGIDATNAGDVVQAGASGVAAIRAILGQTDAWAAAEGLRKAIEDSLRSA